LIDTLSVSAADLYIPVFVSELKAKAGALADPSISIIPLKCGIAILFFYFILINLFCE
jgi:hypothetical protein